MAKITPISGFPEFLPNEQIVFQKTIDLIRTVYESFGFVPLETPAIERVAHLQAKGVIDKEVYAIHRLNAPHNAALKNEFALRFDLTIPLARYVAQHYGRLIFPFRRYQIQPVWRGERPQAGRYRQFYQCDIDIIGSETLSLTHDAEIIAITHQLFTKMDIGPFTIRINNRKMLQGLLNNFGIDSQETTHQAMKIIDDLEKMPREKTIEELTKLNITPENINILLDLFTKNITLEALKNLDISALFKEGVAELSEVIQTVRMQNIPETSCKIDLGIARGLDYYTGTVYETTLDDFPELGSICSGGRYENLAGNFINKKLPGVGISIGLSRLLPQLLKNGILKAPSHTIAPILMTMQNPKHLDKYLSLASHLREANLDVEMYLQEKKLDKQIKYADKKGFKYVIIADDAEIKKGEVLIKKLETGEQQNIPEEELASYLKNALGTLKS